MPKASKARFVGIGCALGVMLAGCIVYVPAPPPRVQGTAQEAQAEASPEEAPDPAALGGSSGWSTYRLLSIEDFQAKTSASLWGNVAHGAEICSYIAPQEAEDGQLTFRALMNPQCSFWNRVIGPAGKLIRVAGAVAGVPTVSPKKQPDWYVLQHEQCHFAINEVGARQIVRQIARLPEERRTPELVTRIYERMLAQTAERQRQLDAETSGTFDPENLDRWVRVLSRQMADLCGSGPECKVETPD